MSGGEALGDVPGLAASLTIMCVLAVILNSIVIVVFATKAQSFTSVHLFIMNLCISDIFLAGIALPVRLDNGSHEGESFKGGDPVCKMIMFIPLLSISSSISTMVAIAVDRFREIIKRHKLLSKQAMYVIMVSWVWSVVVSSPQLYEYSVYSNYDEEYNVTSCGSHDIVENFETVYAVIVIVLSYVVPLILITISYVKIMIFVWKTGKNVAGKESQVLKKRMKIVRLLITITVVFALLWSPYFALFGMEEILGLDDTLHTESGTHVTKNVLVVLSTMSNPVIYFVFDAKFRKDLLQLLTRKPCGQLHVNQVQPSTDVINELRNKLNTASTTVESFETD
ncbi:neuropeptide FF receptor 2-like isoform X1 [Mytilus californianus]|uniref:neuropeptide FF receptor 2-like isoform X1 n=1 Tax=Mytilus californianus TaxID=6549 RepID=UPI00224570E4|nr:neuropeptide FF receptor 2-like isoform X1 [Mytilus californianus]